jgi:hypothetical protein
MANISLTLYTNSFFGSILMYPIQVGSLSVNNSVTNISRLGTFKGEERKENLRPDERAGQLLQEAEKEREALPASPALSDISVFSALDHRYGWSSAAGGGGEREGGRVSPASPALSDISVFSALDHRYGWSSAAGGGEREGGYTRQPCPLRYQRLLCSRPLVWMVSCCRRRRKRGRVYPPALPSQISASSLL